MKNKIVLTARTKLSIDLKELWQYRDLFLMLAFRDFRVRYAQTILGLSWALMQPLLSSLIFVIVFGYFAGMETEVPYPVYVTCGMIAWTYFSYVLSQSGSSLISSQQMVKKIYFPRLIIPLSKALVGFVDLLLAVLIFLGLCWYYQMPLSSNIIFLPLIFVGLMISSLGVGIWFSSLTIRYRDFQHILPFVVQVGLYATPIAYPASTVIDSLPEWTQIVYFLNPIAGVVELFKWAFLGQGAINAMVLLSGLSALVIFISALFYFKRVEYIIADLI